MGQKKEEKNYEYFEARKGCGRRGVRNKGR